ncbi:MAG TPA: class I SAM-dependent methyltransferase [Terriglobia bacterium]|nr:class I SAM-dependent methyltransferase [Terriglobia bacterium]
MPQQATAQQPSPVLFFETLSAYERTEALKAAVELELFTAIGEGAATAQAAAKRCGASERGTRILCDYLTIIGFLTKDGNNYGLTPDTAKFLDKRSEAYAGGAVGFLTSPMLTDGFKNLADAVRKGGTTLAGEGDLEPNHPIWVQFAQSMAGLMTLPAILISKMLNISEAGKMKVLDIAAGHGIFGITLAQHNSNLEVVAVDWPNVLEVAKANAQKAGVAARHRTIAGSAFDVDFGAGYNLVLLTNFLHHFDVPACEKLLKKVHAALVPGGKAVALEFVPNEDRITPPPAATFSLKMLAGTPSGDAYTFSEYQRMFNNAGFSRTELRQLPPTFEQLVIAEK